MTTIAIIGGGFSGTMLAVHLLHKSNNNNSLTIALIERTGRFTAGVAYSTAFNSHLLNVPAGRMSAFENDQSHFLRWAQQRDPSIKGGTFVPRRLYGDYLADVLNQAEAAAHTNTQLLRVPAQALNIATGNSDQLTIDLGGGGLIRADKVVLAIGNFPPADPPVADPSFYDSPLYSRDPWAPDALHVPSDQPVLLLGTGLTMLDIALALEDQGHQGPIIAMSRRGLLPQPHRHSDTPPPHHDRPATLDQWPATARGILRALRHEVQAAQARDVDWREVVTSIRADTPALWQKLSTTQRACFLRHVRPYWETHRHRAAPQIAKRIDKLIQSGQLKVIAGRVIEYKLERNAVDVTVQHRGGPAASLCVANVINCTGPDTNLARVREPLIEHLRDRGIIRPDSLGLGLDTDPTGAIIRADGKPCQRLYLTGPLRKGQLWENTAVPELRIEVENLAATLLGNTHQTQKVNIDAGFAMQC